tara:strand:+ start:729 stop:950 length:222 start_codon:yes stop_codon:yes gene_type:complete
MSYQEPNYRTYRERVGIQTWRSVRVPAGYITKIIDAKDEADLRKKINHLSFYETHYHEARPLTLNDLRIVEWS